MATARVTANIDGKDIELSLGYDVFGKGRPFILTPGGGHFSRQYPGIKETASALADLGNQVIIWDKPNCGESDACFTGETDSTLHADFLAALIRHLGIAPALMLGGSAGSRVSLLAAARHPETLRGIAVWWLTGGVFGRMSVGAGAYGPSIRAAWNGGMAAVVELPQWQELLNSNPNNRERFLALDPKEFIVVQERWMASMSPTPDQVVPALTNTRLRERVTVPALVVRSGVSDMFHPLATSDELASVLPNVEYVDAPWPDTEYVSITSPTGQFRSWPQLAPILHDWANRHFA